MGRYRKLPVEIEAVQFVKSPSHPAGTNLTDLVAFVGPEKCDVRPPSGLIIHTLEGDHYAGVGDWIIKGVAGEFYPCKPDIFAATYEAVDA